MKEYERYEFDGKIPQTLKVVMVFIDRVGFPTLAFCLMFWLSFTSLQKVTDAVNRISTSTESFQSEVRIQHKTMLDLIIKEGYAREK